MPARDRLTVERERRRAEPPAARSKTPHARIDALQRSAGNAAVARLLQRAPKPEAPRQGGWNEKAQSVGGSLRFQVTGLATGNQAENVASGSKEGAAGKAIVVVPDGVDVYAKPDVLLFFHGMGNLGYRERTTDDKSRGAKGTVHDVEADQIPQQLAHSGRNIIGILPQGTNDAIFSIANPQAYVDEVLKAAQPQLPKPPPGGPATITAGRIIVSGHSGGGRAATSAAKALTAKPPATDDEWVKATPLFLFDGVNGPGEAVAVGKLMQQWLDADLARLQATKDPVALLARRGIKLRSTHTASELYKATNLGGEYDYTRTLKERDENNKPKTETIHIVITREKSVIGHVETWFKLHKGDVAKLDPSGKLEAVWRAQYEVPAASVGGGHEATVGTGKLETDPKKRTSAPSGLTGPSKDAGVPDYSGGGHLEESLSRLPQDAVKPPPPPPPKKAELDEDEDHVLEEQYA